MEYIHSHEQHHQSSQNKNDADEIKMLYNHDCALLVGLLSRFGIGQQEEAGDQS